MGLKARTKVPSSNRTRLVFEQGASSKFWDCKVQGDRVLITYGRLGSQGKLQSKSFSTKEKAAGFARKSISEKVGKGYQSESLRFERVPWSTVKSRVRVAGNGESDDDIVLVHQGDLHIPHNLEMDYRRGLLQSPADSPDEVVVGILIEGSLTIDGCLLNYENDFGPFLQVRGSLVANAVATGGSQVHVSGDLRTEELVGVYNHGCVHVSGEVISRVVATEHLVRADKGITALEFLGWHSTTYQLQKGKALLDEPYDIRGVFREAALYGQSVDLSKARRVLASGRKILKETPTSVREDFRRLVAKKLDAPEKVKRLSLTMKDLRQLPTEILLFTNLEVLDLTHNKLRTLPESIGKLTELRELHVRGNGLQCLPESIGKLTKLQILDLEANCITGLPDSLAKCTELRHVCMQNNPYAPVSASFGGWNKVRTMQELPEVLTRLPKLEQLVIDDTLIRTLPARPFDSPHLQKVKYEDTLLLQIDQAMHPQFKKPNAKETKRWSVAHIGFWFDDDTICLSSFYNVKRDSYDFENVKAIQRIVLDILIPAAAPYKDALAKFKKECTGIVRSLNWKNESRNHVQALFGALSDELTDFDKTNGVPALLFTGLKAVFDKYRNGEF